MAEIYIPGPPVYGFLTLENPEVDLRLSQRADRRMRSFVVGAQAVERFTNEFAPAEGLEIVGSFSTQDPTFRGEARITIGRFTSHMICEVGHGATRKDVLDMKSEY